MLKQALNEKIQENESEALRFSISARTAILLGQESISSPVVAVLELVKNAYDADAKQVTVRFRRASQPDGTIEILDDGHGMSWGDIVTKWMVIGTNNKQVNPESPKGRVKAGEKGVGRFALDRLAALTILETTPEYEPLEPSYRLTVDWDKFVNTSKTLNEIENPINRLERRTRPGTRLQLNKLRDRWTRRDYENIYRNLAILIPPFGTRVTGFSIKFDCDEAKDLSGVIQSPMSKAALFKMRASLDEDNRVRMIITTRDDSPDGNFRSFTRYNRTWQEFFDILDEQPGQPQCGPLEFEFYFFLREGPSLRDVDITLGQLREFLNLYGGMRIYRDGFRVKTYGDPGKEGDWLGLNYRKRYHNFGVRSRRGKWAVGADQIVAGLFISRNTNPNLIDQTNREALADNQAFRDMRNFALKCIEIFESDRQEYERGKAASETPSVEDLIEETKQDINERIKALEELLSGIPATEFANVLADLKETQRERFERLENIYREEQQETISKQQLLQNLATIGIAVSAMGHEVIETSANIVRTIRRLQKRITSLMLLADEKVTKYAARLDRYGRVMYSISNFALGHIDRDKRRRQKINVDSIIQKLYDETLQEMCATNEVDIEITLGGVPDIYAFPYEIESIVINFVTNAIAAFQRGHIPLKDRKIEIETRQIEARQIQIIVRDSGPGIPIEDSKRIFGFYSTKTDRDGKPIGAGLGLTIVRDIVESYKGKIEVTNKGKQLPGAEFIVTLPVPKERGQQKGKNHG